MKRKRWSLRIAGVDPRQFLRILLFLACVPSTLFAVRAIDSIAFDAWRPRQRKVPAPLLLREVVSIVLYALAFGSAMSFIFNRSVTGFLATGTVVAAVLGLALQETLGVPQINVDYHAAPATVISVLTQAATHVDGVVQEMPCFARVAGFADYSARDRIDAVHPYEAPSQRLHPEPEKIRRRLAGIDILSPIARDVQQTIADAARVHVYAKGETIIRHGAEGDSMFIVHDGSVSVRVEDGEVARLEPGDFFGEMASRRILGYDGERVGSRQSAVDPRPKRGWAAAPCRLPTADCRLAI